MIKKKKMLLSVAIVLSLSLTACGGSIFRFIFGTDKIGDDIATTTTEEITTEAVPPSESDNEAFDKWMTDAFVKEVSEDTISLHYSLKDPSAYGIELAPTFGNLDFSDTSKSVNDINNYLSELLKFDYSSLSERQQNDYDVFKTYLEDNLKKADFNIMYTTLGKVNGVPANLPINLAEYRFYVEKDITDYLALLSQVPDVFDAMVSFEEKRIEEGYGLQDTQLDEVIKQCNSFTEAKDNNYLIETFSDRLDEYGKLDASKKEEYIGENKKLIKETVIPAYERLAKSIEAMKGRAKISGGLCQYDRGKEFYELLVRTSTGSKRSVSEIIKLLDQGIDDALNMMYQASALDYSGYVSYFDKSPDYGSTDPSVIMDTLKLMTTSCYPVGNKTDYTIKYVEKSLEDSLSPAFYMIPPVDGEITNVIYINRGSTDTDSLYTTLAHEGFPGHLYQNNYYRAQKPNPLRLLLNFRGYSEGWATFAELQSPKYFTFLDHDEAYTLLEEANDRLNLCVSSRIDIGVNYQNWSLKDVESYMSKKGFSTESTERLYNYVVAEPANYLEYTVGALEFFDLKKTAEDALGDRFQEKEFNQALLDCGPCQFEYVKRSVEKYIEEYKK